MSAPLADKRSPLSATMQSTGAVCGLAVAVEQVYLHGNRGDLKNAILMLSTAIDAMERATGQRMRAAFMREFRALKPRPPRTRRPPPAPSSN